MTDLLILEQKRSKSPVRQGNYNALNLCNQQVGGSNPSTSSTSPQRPDRSLPRKRESSLPTVRLLSKSNPLRWASIWFRRQLNTEEFPSGQRGQTVNLLRFASVVRIHPPPPRRSKLSAPVRFCSFPPNRQCRKMAGKHVQPLNNYTCRFRLSSLIQADKSGLDRLHAGK